MLLGEKIAFSYSVRKWVVRRIIFPSNGSFSPGPFSSGRPWEHSCEINGSKTWTKEVRRPSPTKTSLLHFPSLPWEQTVTDLDVFKREGGRGGKGKLRVKTWHFLSSIRGRSETFSTPRAFYSHPPCALLDPLLRVNNKKFLTFNGRND